MMTVSMSTWDSFTSMFSITSLMARMSALRAMTTMPLMRLSASTFTLSLLSSPRREALVFWNVGLFAAPGRGVAGRCVVRLRVVAAPLFAFAF